MIEIKRYTDFKKIEKEWDRLWSENGEISVYNSVPYVSLFWRHRFPYKIILQMNPVFYVFFEDEKLIMILPLFKGWFGGKYRLFGYKAGFGYLDVLYGKNVDEEKIDQCMRLLYQRDGIERIESTHVRESSRWAKYLLTHGGRYCESPCIAIHLPETYEEYFSDLSKHARQNMRTSYNRANRDGMEITFHHYRSSDIPEDERKALTDLYISRQITRYKKKGFVYRFFLNYIDIGTYAQKDPSGLEDVFFIKINNKISAYFDGIMDCNKIIVPRLAIDEQFSWYSPGILLLNESIRYLIENTKIREVDLTHGEEKYKLVMGGDASKCVEGTLFLKE